MESEANAWFKSYFSDSKQFVCINGYNSDLMPVDCVVPQDSVLGPILFLINIYISIRQFNTA